MRLCCLALLLIVLFSPLLIGCSEASQTLANEFQIKVDGKIEDWVDVPISIQDYVGDSNYPSIDIDSVYVFRNNENLYLALKTKEKPSKSINVDYFFGIDVDIDGHGDFNIDVSNGNVYLTKYSGNETYKGKLIPDAKVAIDEIVEVAVPLKYLQHPGRIKFIGSGVFLLNERKTVDFVRGWEYLPLLNNTIKIETKNLTIYYPAFLSEDEVEKHAITLQDFYDFCKNITYITPFNGKKIVILFDPSLGYISYYGDPIIMGRDSGVWDGKVFPPEPPFFHELVHTFTVSEVSKAYTDMNGAINEAFSDLFTYYYGRHVLNDDRYDGWEKYMVEKLAEYEKNKINPYELDWGPHKSAQPYVMAILFAISEKYGWDLWNRFFEISKEYDFLRMENYRPFSYTNLSKYQDKNIFNRFVLLLSLSVNEDLRPLFKKWGFDFPKDKELDELYPDKKASPESILIPTKATKPTTSTTLIQNSKFVILDDEFTDWNVDAGEGNRAYKFEDLVNFTSGDKSLKLVAKINSKKERFAAVWFSLEGYNLSAYDGIEFWSYAPYSMEGAVLSLQLWEKGGVVYYKIVRNLSKPGWQFHRVPFSELTQGWWGNKDQNSKLDLDRLAVIAISIDANRANGENYAINIDAVEFYKGSQDDQRVVTVTPSIHESYVGGPKTTMPGFEVIFALVGWLVSYIFVKR